MATYEKAISHILKWEGGYANVEGDGGGETYRGISRKNNPNWVGWKRIDELRPKHNEIIPELEAPVISFYKVTYWNKIMGNNILSDKVALFLFDWFVNSGYHAIESVQKLVNVRIDGVMGTNTIRSINNYAGDLYKDMIIARTKKVKAIALNRPTQEKFLKGWLNRIDYYSDMKHIA